MEYRIQDCPRVSTLSELARTRFVKVPSKTPEDPYHPVAEWYCENETCKVREVCITTKHRKKPLADSSMRCPACSRPLKLHGYFTEKMLVPVQSPDGGTGEE